MYKACICTTPQYFLQYFLISMWQFGDLRSGSTPSWWGRHPPSNRLSWGSGCPEEGGTEPTCRNGPNLPRESGEQSGVNAWGGPAGKTQFQAPTRELQKKVKPMPAPYCPKCPKGGGRGGTNSVLLGLDTSSLNLFQHPSFFALQDTLA